MVTFKSAALLVWLDADEQLSDQTFQVHNESELPERQGFWEFGAALIFAMTAKHPTKLPWIKVGDTVLDYDDSRDAYERLKAGEEF